MKNLNRLILASAALIIGSSCAETEDAAPVTVDKQMTISAHNNSVTRTTLTDSYAIHWCSEDELAVYSSEDQSYEIKKYTTSIASGTTAATAEFTGDAVTFKDGGAYVVHPHSIARVSQNGLPIVNLQQTQLFDASGSFASGSNPLVGIAEKTGENISVNLNCVCGVLRLYLKGSGTVENIKVAAAEGNLWGDCEINFTLDSENITPDGGKEVTLNCNVALDSAQSKKFAISLPPTQSQLSVTINMADGSTIEKTLDSDIKSGVVLEMPELEIGSQVGGSDDIVINDLVLPTGAVAKGSSVDIAGSGFAQGDIIRMTSEGYPSALKYDVATIATDNKISFTLPAECYGVNSLQLLRGEQTYDLGTIGVAVELGDKVGGGVVYFTSDNGTHGLIAGVADDKGNVITLGEIAAGKKVVMLEWGPRPYAVGVAEKGVYKSKPNTELCVSKMIEYRAANPGSKWDSEKTCAELCAEYSATIDDVLYDDWCMPSNDALVELFNTRAALGLTVIKNNYWSSTEAPKNGTNDIEAMAWYVNFYEATKVVNTTKAKDTWKVGVLPIRQF